MNRPVCYAYNADIHCPECAEKAGMTGNDASSDSEGTAGYSWENDAYPHGYNCRDCGEEIFEASCEGCVDCLPIMRADSTNMRYGERIVAVNPTDGLGRFADRCYVLWFGTGSTKLAVWARHLDDALDIAGGWIEDHAPGLFCDDAVHEAYNAALAEAVQGGADPEDEDVRDEAMRAAEEDTTSLDGGHYLPSWEWGIVVEAPSEAWVKDYMKGCGE